MNEYPLVSIVTVNWNTKDLTLDCIRSVMQGTYPAIEFILIDNASCDGTGDAVREEFPQVILIENQVNVGLIKANNQGMRCSSGEYVLLLNSDTVMFPHVIERLVEFLESHACAGAVGPKLVYPNGSKQSSGGRHSTLLDLFLFSSAAYHTYLSKTSTLGRLLRARKREATSPQQVEWLSGACLLVRRSVIDQIGLMNESFHYYCLDSEWCYRMSKVGAGVWYLPIVRVIHYEGASTKQARSDTVRSIAMPLLFDDEFTYRRIHRGYISERLARLSVSLGAWTQLALLPLWTRIGYLEEVQAEQYRRVAREVARVAISASHPRLVNTEDEDA